MRAHTANLTGPILNHLINNIIVQVLYCIAYQSRKETGHKYRVYDIFSEYKKKQYKLIPNHESGQERERHACQMVQYYFLPRQTYNKSVLMVLIHMC